MMLQEERARAVGELVERVRAIETREGVTRASLDKIKAELIALASRSELFPAAQLLQLRLPAHGGDYPVAVIRRPRRSPPGRPVSDRRGGLDRTEPGLLSSRA